MTLHENAYECKRNAQSYLLLRLLLLPCKEEKHENIKTPFGRQRTSSSSSSFSSSISSKTTNSAFLSLALSLSLSLSLRYSFVSCPELKTRKTNERGGHFRYGSRRVCVPDRFPAKEQKEANSKNLKNTLLHTQRRRDIPHQNLLSLQTTVTHAPRAKNNRTRTTKRRSFERARARTVILVF